MNSFPIAAVFKLITTLSLLLLLPLLLTCAHMCTHMLAHPQAGHLLCSVQTGSIRLELFGQRTSSLFWVKPHMGLLVNAALSVRSYMQSGATPRIVINHTGRSLPLFKGSNIHSIPIKLGILGSISCLCWYK